MLILMSFLRYRYLSSKKGIDATTLSHVAPRRTYQMMKSKLLLTCEANTNVVKIFTQKL